MPADAPITNIEQPPPVRTADLLEPSLLRSPVHQVRELAATDGYLAQVVIDSDYGTFICGSAAQARQRIVEIQAIQKLLEVSKSDAFAEGLKRSVGQPVNAVRNIIKNPVGAAKEVPHSVGHFFKRLGRTIESTAESALPGAHERTGEYVVPAPVDYISWTESVADFATRDDLTMKRPTLLLTGGMTARALQGFQGAGWKVERP